MVTNIVYTVSGGATGASVSGLPSGMSGVYNAGAFTFTISGTPTVSGTLGYTVTTTGTTCNTATATGTITVLAQHTISLSSGSSTPAAFCQSTALATNIVYAVGGGATSASVSGLPSGMSGVYSAGTFTISGTPTASGSFAYTVTTSGNACGNQTATGTITVKSLIDYANLQYPGSGSMCQGGSYTVYGQVYETGVTPGAGQGAGITAELGYSTTNSNPSTWTNWQTATFNSGGGAPNNDEYQANLTGLVAGTYYYAYRYTLGGCQYQYGGYNIGGGGFWDGTSNVSGVLTVNANPTLSVPATAANACPAVTADLTTLSSSNGTRTYFDNAGLSSTVTPPTMVGAGTYYIKATGAGGFRHWQTCKFLPDIFWLSHK